jgi:hypothetical protein
MSAVHRTVTESLGWQIEGVPGATYAAAVARLALQREG